MPRELHEVLIVGAGSIGERHLRCFLATERVRASFVEVNCDLAKQVSERYPQAQGFSSLQAALEHRFHAAVIATPAPLHIPQALECVKQGMHVLIEKPLSVELTGIDQLMVAVDRTGVTAATAYVYRAHPVLAEFRQVLHSGKYGRAVQLVAVGGQNFPTYRPAYAQTYYNDRKSGGGAVQDALTHILNAGEWLLGPIDRLTADVDHLLLPKVTVEDTVHVLARQGRVMANYSLNQHQTANEIVFTVACEHGTLRYENHLCRWRVMERPDGPWIDSSPVTLERDTLFTRQANAFLDATEGKCPPLCSLPEGLMTLGANRAVLKSAETGQWCVPAQEIA